MKAKLRVVTGENKVVAIVVCNDGILMAIVKGIEQAIGIFFGLIEPNDVVLVLVA
jgi:hypothetical protein